MSLSPHARDLVRKAAADAPSAERRERARKRFAEASAAIVAGAVVSATAGSAAGKAKATLTSAKVLLWAKVVAGLAVVVVGAFISTRSAPPAPQGPIATAIAIPPPPGASMEPVSVPSVLPEPALPPVGATRAMPPAPVVRARPAPSATSESTSNPTADPLVYEAKVLEGARACLAAADVACARARLNEHARIEHPHLRDEGAVMNIEVLRAEGRRDDARKAAATFLEQRPTSPYVKRVHAIVLLLSEDGR